MLAARRAMLHCLHVSAVSAGLVALVVWGVFHHAPAACVAGGAWMAGGLLALLARRGLSFHPATFRGALLQAYAAALLTLGALLLRSGATAPAGPAPSGSLPSPAPERYDPRGGWVEDVGEDER
jgi:hypothetical protein